MCIQQFLLVLAVQALMPVAVFVVGCAFGTEKYSGGTLVNMLIVSLGVAIASYGKLIGSVVEYCLANVTLPSRRMKMLLQGS